MPFGMNSHFACPIRGQESTQYFGKPLAYSRSIRDNKSVYWMKMDLMHMGLEVKHSHEIPGRIREVIQAFVMVELKTNGKYKNVYIQDAAERPDKVLEKMKQTTNIPKSTAVYKMDDPVPIENDFADSIDPKNLTTISHSNENHRRLHVAFFSFFVRKVCIKNAWRIRSWVVRYSARRTYRCFKWTQCGGVHRNIFAWYPWLPRANAAISGR